jgi:hypothetical protein
MHAVYDELISGPVSQDVQWKCGETGQDNRQGISHLFNVLAVIGGKKISEII